MKACFRSLLKTVSLVVMACVGFSGFFSPVSQAGSIAHSKVSPLNSALEKAVKQAQIETIKKLLLQGADPNYKTSGLTRDPLLWVALSQNQPRIVKLLLKAGATADVSDHRGTPLLIGALSLASAKTTRNTPLFKSILGLLKKGRANPAAQDKAYIGDNRGPLHMAVSTGSRDLVQLLLDFGANPNLKNRSHETALHFAAERGYTDIVQLLLARSPLARIQIDAYTKHTHMTPLLAAAENGHAEIVQLLISKGANVDARDAFGKSAVQLLKASAQKRHMAQAQLAQTEQALRTRR